MELSRQKVYAVYMRRILLLLSLLVSGCASETQFLNVSRAPEIPPLPSVTIEQMSSVVKDNGKFNSEPLAINEVLRLTEAQKKDFLTAFNSKQYASLNPNRRIFEYLKKYLKNFNFYSNTLIAREALNKQLGNCLSLAIVTKSLADLAGVRVGYELVSTTPVYQREGEITLSSQHVRTILYKHYSKPQPNTFVVTFGNIIVDYFPARGSHRLRNVSESEFFSMYYRNKSAEALIQGDIFGAFRHAKVALEYAPMDAQSINLMAVIHHRAGFEEEADKIYQYALRYGKESLELLSNYHSFLMLNHRYAEAALIQKKVDEYEDLNPFVWVDLGNTAFANRDYNQAIKYFRKAAKMADYIHEPYLGMARSYFMLGRIKTAQSMMKKAIEKSHRNETRSLFQKKYELLSKLAAQ